MVSSDDPACLRIVDFLAAGSRAAGGDPDLGRRVRPLLHSAGFSPTVGSMSVHAHGDSETAPYKADAWADLASGSTLAANAIARGLFSAAEPDQTAAALRRLAGIWQAEKRNEEGAKALLQRADSLDPR